MAMALRWFVVVGFAVVRSKNFKLELCGEIKKARKQLLVSKDKPIIAQRTISLALKPYQVQ